MQAGVEQARRRPPAAAPRGSAARGRPRRRRSATTSSGSAAKRAGQVGAAGRRPSRRRAGRAAATARRWARLSTIGPPRRCVGDRDVGAPGGQAPAVAGGELARADQHHLPRSARSGVRQAREGDRASVKQEPAPGVLSTVSVPPIRLASWRAIGEPEAGAAVAARGRLVGLGEALEDPLLRLVRDADAGVLDLDPERHPLGVDRLAARAGCVTLPCVGELDARWRPD